MAWTNLFDIPDVWDKVELYINVNGTYLYPEDYEEYGITVTIEDGRITVTTPADDHPVFGSVSNMTVELATPEYMEGTIRLLEVEAWPGQEPQLPEYAYAEAGNSQADYRVDGVNGLAEVTFDGLEDSWEYCYVRISRVDPDA